MGIFGPFGPLLGHLEPSRISTVATVRVLWMLIRGKRWGKTGIKFCISDEKEGDGPKVNVQITLCM